MQTAKTKENSNGELEDKVNKGQWELGLEAAVLKYNPDIRIYWLIDSLKIFYKPRPPWAVISGLGFTERKHSTSCSNSICQYHICEECKVLF